MSTVKTSFTTSREYRTDGIKQTILVEYVPFTGTIWDENSCDCVLVKMEDLARGVNEMVVVLRSECTAQEINSAVLRSYDACNYSFGEIGAIAPRK